MDSLAEQLMENAADGKVNFDDEDPNLSDWSDYDVDNGKPASLEDEYSLRMEDGDDFSDAVIDSDTDESVEKLRGSADLYVDSNEYELKHVEQTDDSKDCPRRKKRKTPLGFV